MLSEFVLAKQSFGTVANKLGGSAWIEHYAGAELRRCFCRICFRNVKPVLSERLHLDFPFEHNDSVTAACHKDSKVAQIVRKAHPTDVAFGTIGFVRTVVLST